MKPFFKQTYFMTRDSDDYTRLHENEPYLQVATTETLEKGNESTVTERTWLSRGKTLPFGFDHEGKYPVSQEQPIKVEMELWTSEL